MNKKNNVCLPAILGKDKQGMQFYKHHWSCKDYLCPVLHAINEYVSASTVLHTKMKNFQELMGFSRIRKSTFRDQKKFQELVASHTNDLKDWNIL